MAEYKMSQNINANKVFFINRSEIEGRLEAEYYAPKINLLEKRIRIKTNKKLRDFILKISSGATPSVEEEEKYYSDEQNGVPFLRVQNLQVNGKLDLTDVKFINKETHAGYLKRSQVAEGDLLVKITGVGRMAIASVAPEGFVGNTNQHMVVIKTGSRAKSEYLAQYLNLDISEKLASRRSTGATRPALDYPALKSLPIVENVDFTILAKAEKQKQLKENEAKALLDSIDAYLLKELGIELPRQDNSLKSRIFTSKFSELSGNRLNPEFYSNEYKILETFHSKANFISLNRLCSQISDAPHERPDFSDETGIEVVMIENLKPDGIQTENQRYITPAYHSKLKSTVLKKDDLLMARIGVTTGVTSIVDDFHVGKNISGNITLIRIKSELVNKKFVLEFLNSYLGKLNIKRILSNSARDFLTVGKIKSLKIPDIDLARQNEISRHIQKIRTEAKRLQNEANKVLEKAKAEVEKMILG